MSASREPDRVPEVFRRAQASVRAAKLRSEVSLSEAPAPTRLAPHALALTAEVSSEGTELATGRFVVLHDPAEPAGWGGTFRLVTYVRADLEPETAVDPLLAEVGWSWLMEALDVRGAKYLAASGTVSRVSSEGFGELADRPPAAEVEIRASWTPIGDDLEPHLAAWGELLCTAAGLPPLPPGVTPLRSARPRAR
ncbi:MAG: DUF3000 domain-containing protein [Actinomycetes bacterium]|jgi:hypothetical protein|nr:DUF3000 domain-containing protein [Actinomycetes bacterium]